MEEIWKDIKGYEGLYQVSDLGRVKSLGNEFTRKEKFLKHGIDHGHYLVVFLHRNSIGKSIKIHKLVAISFMGHIPCGHKEVVDHVDGNKENNSLINLRIVTQRENSTTCFRKDKEYLTSKYIGVSWDKNSNKWHSRIWINKKSKHLGLFNLEIDASDAYQKALKLYV